MSIGTRIKELRNLLNLSQTEFATNIGLKQAAIGLYENDQRTVPDTTVLLISQVYNVSPEWLRTGQGEMLVQNADSLIDQLSAEYHLDGIDRAIIDGYLQLGTLQRKVIKDYLSSVSAAFTSTNVQAFKMPAHGNSAAQGILSTDDQSAMGKIKDDLSTEDDSDKI